MVGGRRIIDIFSFFFFFFRRKRNIAKLGQRQTASSEEKGANCCLAISVKFAARVLRQSDKGEILGYCFFSAYQGVRDFIN